MKDKIIHSKLIQWISGWKISKKLREHPFFSKFFNYEFISYLVVGVLTTVVNYVIFWICSYLLDMSTVPANTIAFIIAVTFAYVANKIFVFDSPSWSLPLSSYPGFSPGESRRCSSGSPSIFFTGRSSS